MQDVPSPLDHLAAFVLVFGLGALSACLWNASLCMLKAAPDTFPPRHPSTPPEPRAGSADEHQDT